MRFIQISHREFAHGLDTRNHKTNRRYYALLNKEKEVVLVVQANLYFPDCFNWKKLHGRGWTVHVMKGKPNEERERENDGLY